MSEQQQKLRSSECVHGVQAGVFHQLGFYETVAASVLDGFLPSWDEFFCDELAGLFCCCSFSQLALSASSKNFFFSFAVIAR